MENLTMPDETATLPTKVKFIFKKSDDYNLHFVNGLFGGFTAQGELVINFFFESRVVPDEQEGKIEGTTINYIPVSTPMDFIREMKCGIIMTPQQAYTLRDWLNLKLNELEQKFKPSEKV
jgi:hypothetical protein